MWIICELFEVVLLANRCSLDWPLSTELPQISSSYKYMHAIPPTKD